MRLDDRLCDAEEGRAADLVLIEHLAEVIHALFAQQIADLGAGRGGEHLLDLVRHEFRRTLDRLEQNVAHEAVADRDVARAERYLTALNVADEIEPACVACGLEQRICLPAERIALGVLGAVVDQTDARRLQSVVLLRIQGREEGELEQHFRRALGVRTGVAQHDLAALAGQDRRERRAADTLDAAAVQRRAGQQRAGIARGDERIALACLEQLERDRHGRVRLAAQNGRRVVVHVNDIRSRHDGQMLGVLQSMRAQHGGDRLGLADEQDILAIFLRSERRAPDGYVGGVVAAHRVNDDLHSQSSPFRLSMRSSARSEIFAFFSRLPLIL